MTENKPRCPAANAAFPFDELGSSLEVDVVVPAVVSMQLAVPQLYPVGQQPGTAPPASPSQRYQPPAQSALSWPVGTAVTGTATVTPWSVRMVVEVMGGQEVVLQSRPVWQHPPPAEARQG